MAVINLREFYPFYGQDCLLEISQEILDVLQGSRREEEAYRIRTLRHKAYYSLDMGDNVEGCALFAVVRPDEIYERKVTYQQLHAALCDLPPKQAQRIYAHYILGMSKTAIARAESVDERAVRASINRGLKNLERQLKNFL